MRRADVFDLFARERARFAARFPHVAAARLVLVDAYHLPRWERLARRRPGGSGVI